MRLAQEAFLLGFAQRAIHRDQVVLDSPPSKLEEYIKKDRANALFLDFLVSFY